MIYNRSVQDSDLRKIPGFTGPIVAWPRSSDHNLPAQDDVSRGPGAIYRFAGVAASEQAYAFMLESQGFFEGVFGGGGGGAIFWGGRFYVEHLRGGFRQGKANQRLVDVVAAA